MVIKAYNNLIFVVILKRLGRPQRSRTGVGKLKYWHFPIRKQIDFGRKPRPFNGLSASGLAGKFRLNNERGKFGPREKQPETEARI